MPNRSHALSIDARRAALPPRLAETADAFEGYLTVECGLSRATIEAYGRDAVELLEDAAASDATEPSGLTPRVVTEHIRALSRRGLASGTIARRLSTIRVLSRWLLATARVEHDPAALIEAPARWRRLPGVLKPSEMRRLLEAPAPPDKPAPGPALWQRDKAILELLYASGLRASELCSLELNAMIEPLHALRITGKGGRQRLVPMGEPADRAITAYLKDCRAALVEANIARGTPARDAGRVFLSKTGKPLDRVRIWQMVSGYAHRSGIGHVHPHQLRHSFATDLLAGGADLRAVQELLGHADISTTQIYTHVDRSALKAMHAKLHPRG